VRLTGDVMRSSVLFALSVVWVRAMLMIAFTAPPARLSAASARMDALCVASSRSVIETSP